MIIVLVNCPVSGCGKQMKAESLPKHLSGVHDIQGEVVIRLNPQSAMTITPPLPEPETEPEPEPETEPETDQ
ncbi:hypothetical protein ES705_14580 [subsurface metagenome]